MKSYASISKEIRKDISVLGFNKLDGSCIRAEWNKKGFYKFGTRTELLNLDSPFAKAIPLVKEQEDKLIKIFEKQKYQSVVCFFELYGPSSFAGQHNFNEDMSLTLFDIDIYKAGILEPSKFIDLFGGIVSIPEVLYSGKVDEELIKSVKNSELEGMSLEGLVCKSSNDKKTKQPIMFKIKSNAWLDKLKVFCKDNKILYDKLS